MAYRSNACICFYSEFAYSNMLQQIGANFKLYVCSDDDNDNVDSCGRDGEKSNNYELNRSFAWNKCTTDSKPIGSFFRDPSFLSLGEKNSVLRRIYVVSTKLALAITFWRRIKKYSISKMAKTNFIREHIRWIEYKAKEWSEFYIICLVKWWQWRGRQLWQRWWKK